MENHVQDAAVFGQNSLLVTFVFIDLEQQVEDLAGRIELMHGQPVFVPGDLREIQILSGLEDERAKTGVVSNQFGDRLVYGNAVFPLQLIEIARQDSDTWGVAEPKLNTGIVQAAEDFELTEMLGKA